MPSVTLPALVTSLPPATRALTLLLIVASALMMVLRISSDDGEGQGPSAFPGLVLLPGAVIWYPWTLLTSSWVETNLVEFLISLLTLPLAGRYLERVWGQVELLKFVGAVLLASNVIAVAVNVIESIVLGNTSLFLFQMNYHGLQALQVGFLVAFTQLIPEHQVQVFGGLIKVRVKSLPMLYVTVSNVACLIGYQSPWILIQFGWIVAWFYLRFIKRNGESDFRGDRSETFAFAGWFPPFVQPYVSRATTIVFNLAVKFGVLPAWHDIESGLGASTGGGVGARAEAERRRAMALKALDQRLASKPTTTSAQPSPSLASTSAAGVAMELGAVTPGVVEKAVPALGEDKARTE